VLNFATPSGILVTPWRDPPPKSGDPSESDPLHSVHVVCGRKAKSFSLTCELADNTRVSTHNFQVRRVPCPHGADGHRVDEEGRSVSLTRHDVAKVHVAVIYTKATLSRDERPTPLCASKRAIDVSWAVLRSRSDEVRAHLI